MIESDIEKDSEERRAFFLAVGEPIQAEELKALPKKVGQVNFSPSQDQEKPRSQVLSFLKTCWRGVELTADCAWKVIFWTSTFGAVNGSMHPYGAINNIVSAHHDNGTCPELSSLPRHGITTSYPTVCSAVSGKLHLPLEYCAAFNKQEIEDSFEVMGKKLLKDFSVKGKRKFGIFVGERHEYKSDLILKLNLLSLAHAMGISKVLVEFPPEAYKGLESQALSASSSSLRTPAIYILIQAAKYLDMDVILIDLAGRPLSLKETEMCQTMKSIYNPEREEAFCDNIIRLKSNFIAFLGHLHLSYFPNRCEGINDLYMASYFFLQPKDSKEKIERALKEVKACNNPYISQRHLETIVAKNDNQHLHIHLTTAPDVNLGLLLKLLMLKVINRDEISDDFLKDIEGGLWQKEIEEYFFWNES